MAMTNIVQIQSGLIRGVIEKDEDGSDYYAFKGIPYAEPPIGELRFEDPIRIKKWNGVRDAKNYGPACAQVDIFFQRKIDSEEDCLYLNVFTKTINQKSTKKAVMVWIHGGGFITGSGDDTIYGPQYLMRKDIVCVTINYRLGVFGFLNLEDEVAPGNQGLKDQVLALQWVRENIQAFGGNPNNITIFGGSAGAVAVHLLTLSPLAKGLIHKAISLGGIVYNGWTRVPNPRKDAIKLCELLGKELQDSKAIVKFLKTIDVQKLQETQEQLRLILGYFPFGPGIDAKSSRPFMPICPRIASDEAVHIPYLVGYAEREGTFVMLEAQKEQFVRDFNSNFNSILQFGSDIILKRYNLNANQVKQLIFKNEKMSIENIDMCLDFLGEIHFNEGIHKFLKVQAQRSTASTYMYQFSYDTTDSFSDLYMPVRAKGATHMDELKYLFKMRLFNEKKQDQLIKGTQSFKMMERMTELWTNFAKYGKPTITTSELIPVHWRPVVDGTLLQYMNIDEHMSMQYSLNVDQKYLSAKDIKIE